MKASAFLDDESITHDAPTAPEARTRPTLRRERGHLALVQWSDTEAAMECGAASPPERWRFQALRPSLTDAAVGLLLLLSAGAAVASFLHLG